MPSPAEGIEVIPDFDALVIPGRPPTPTFCGRLAQEEFLGRPSVEVERPDTVGDVRVTSGEAVDRVDQHYPVGVA